MLKAIRKLRIGCGKISLPILGFPRFLLALQTGFVLLDSLCSFASRPPLMNSERTPRKGKFLPIFSCFVRCSFCSILLLHSWFISSFSLTSPLLRFAISPCFVRGSLHLEAPQGRAVRCRSPPFFMEQYFPVFRLHFSVYVQMNIFDVFFQKSPRKRVSERLFEKTLILFICTYDRGNRVLSLRVP